MRWFAPRDGLSLALLFCSCLLAQPASIQGVAIDAVTRQPMAGVHITLRARPAIATEREDAETYGAISRPDGHFSIADLKPGVYYLTARHNGYVEVPGKKPGEDSITLKPGDQITDAKVELTPHAVIIGHVLDENSDPVQFADVQADVTDLSGGRSPESMGNARTDERGQFRFALAPGKFYMHATYEPGRYQPTLSGPEIRSDGAVPPVYGDTFYPGAASRDKATLIELTPGQVLTGIDIHLAPRRSVSISGRVTGIDNPRLFYVSIHLSAEENRGLGNQIDFAAPDGTFAFGGLSPGKYRLTANSSPEGDSPLQSIPVEVNPETGDETGVTLALVQGEMLSGKVEIEGATSKLAEKLTIRLTGESDFGEPKRAETDESGNFHIDQVFPEKFRVAVMPLPENAYIKSVRIGSAEVHDGLLDLSHGVAGAALNITLSRNAGRIEGSVVDGEGKPSATPFALVILAASGADIDDSNIRPTQAGDKFSYSGLRPGKYRLVALDPRQLMGARDSPDTLKALVASAPEFEIHENDRLTKDVKMLSPEDSGAK
jgi:hypothetical protein